MKKKFCIIAITLTTILKAQIVSTLAGTGGVQGYVDGTAASAKFFYPIGVATNSLGDVYVADSQNNRIRKISGGVVSTLAGSGAVGNVDGTGTAATFNVPSKITTDQYGNIFVAGGDRVRKITPGGVVTTFVTSSVLAGIMFTTPNIMDIDYDKINNVLWIADFSGNILKATSTGSVNLFTSFGGSANRITSIASAPSGIAYGIRYGGDLIRINTNGTAVTLTTSIGGQGLAVHPLSGNIYIAGAVNASKITEYSTSGIALRTFFAGIVGDKDGISDLAKSTALYDVAFNPNSPYDFYVGDRTNNKIRRVESSVTGSLTPSNVNEQYINGCEGTNAEFTLIPTNATHYQWFKNGVALTNTLNISGATSPSLTISNLASIDQATYTVMYANTYTTYITGNSRGLLNVYPNPTVSATTANTLVCSGDQITLYAGIVPSAPATYTWTSSQGDLNYTSMSFFTPTVTTTYSVLANDYFCNSNIATITVSVSACTEIRENEDLDDFKVYPNPSNSFIYIHTNAKNSAVSVSIFTIEGVLVKQLDLLGLDNKISISELKEGIYFVKTKNDDTINTYKIIKQ